MRIRCKDFSYVKLPDGEVEIIVNGEIAISTDWYCEKDNVLQVYEQGYRSATVFGNYIEVRSIKQQGRE